MNQFYLTHPFHGSWFKYYLKKKKITNIYIYIYIYISVFNKSSR